jgi:SAM-dependent methyltransferase
MSEKYALTDHSEVAVPDKHDALCSLQDRLKQLESDWPLTERTRGNLIRAVDSLDVGAREALIRKYRGRLENLDPLNSLKYSDFAYWARRNVLIAEWLDLDNSHPLDILDIGAGPGNFGMVAQSMGHRVVGTDVADDWYDELCKVTGATRVVAPVVRGERYKPVNARFDLITIMLPVFHRKRIAGKREYWSVEDWRLFLLNLVQDLLQPNGRIFILMPLDKDEAGNLSYSPLIEWARQRGAQVETTFPNKPVRHILFPRATETTFG